jgi:hypothetical protein
MKFIKFVSRCIVFWFVIALIIVGYAEADIYKQKPVGGAPVKEYIGRGDKLLQVDPIGNPMYNKQQFKVSGNEFRPIDSVGNVQYNKKFYKIK